MDNDLHLDRMNKCEFLQSIVSNIDSQKVCEGTAALIYT
jgi:hypothetical protein